MINTDSSTRTAIFRHIKDNEIFIGMMTGGIFGALSGIVVYLLIFLGVTAIPANPLEVGLIVAFGLSGACIASTLLGVFSPLFFAKLGVDPAVAAGPVITAVNDFLSMSIYFLIAIGLSAYFAA